MNCPNCNVPLVMAERQGIEVDYCPQCRGIWLDRGELDKILERSASETQNFNRPNPENPGYPQKGHYKDYRKKSWLNELFD